MDLRQKENKEVKKKLLSTAYKIRKNRKNCNKIKQEIEVYQEIKELLKKTGVESPVKLKESSVAAISSTSTIPVKAPGIEVINNDKIFVIFNEDTLCLKDFLKKGECCNLFGKDWNVPSEDLFRDLIAHHIAESILPDYENCHSVSLYVLYLLSVHSDKHFVCACLDFLKYRRFEVSSAEILPILYNFGATPEILIGSDVAVDPPKICSRRVERGKNGKICFPHYNVEMTVNAILHNARLGLVKKDPELKLLIKALTRLTLDSKIRYSRLFAAFSHLVSCLSTQLNVNEAVSCLHLDDEHLLNRMEVAAFVHMPISSVIHEALINESINYILKSKTLQCSIKVRNVSEVLGILNEKKFSALEVYCILQLINSALPSVTATSTEVIDISDKLVSLEAGLCNVKDSLDLIRVRLEIAKLRSLVVNQTNKKVYMAMSKKLN